MLYLIPFLLVLLLEMDPFLTPLFYILLIKIDSPLFPMMPEY